MVRPKGPNLIIAKKKGNRNRFFINRDVPLEKNDWEFVEDETNVEHSEFCCRQVTRRDRQYDLNIINHGTAPKKWTNIRIFTKIS